MSVAGVLFVTFVVLLVLNVPIALCLGVSAIVAMVLAGLPMDMFPMTMYASIGKFTLLAIPFFILAGNTMAKAGISGRLIDLANKCVGHRKGGLVVVAIITTCIFAAISGSGPATVAALGPIIIPAMIKAGYDKGMSTAMMAAAGGVDLLIPPSITFVVYAVIAGVSISEIFIAGIIPGIIMAIGLIFASQWTARKRHIELAPKATWKERGEAFIHAFWALLMPIIILGGIYGGFFTPTEAAAVAAVYGILVGMFIYRSVTLKDLYGLLVESAKGSAVVLLIVASASFFAWFLSTEGISEMASQLLLNVANNQFIFLFIINIILLIAGCFIDATSALYIFTPIMLPVALHFGYDPVALGVVMTLNLAIGLITPPVGADLYVACGISKISLAEISKHVIPYVVVSIIMLMIITYMPWTITFLPKLLGM